MENLELDSLTLEELEIVNGGQGDTFTANYGLWRSIIDKYKSMGRKQDETLALVLSRVPVDRREDARTLVADIYGV